MTGTGRFARRRRDDLLRNPVDGSARRGVDRRRFLQGVGAMAASLAAFELAGCSSAPTRGSSATTRGPSTTTRGPSTTTRSSQPLNVVLFGEGAHGPYQGGMGNTPYTATQLAEIRSYGFGSFTMGAGFFVGQAGTSSGQPGFSWSANPVSGNASYDQQFLYGKAGEPTSVSTMAHAAGLKVYLYLYLAATAPSGIAAQNTPPCAGNWSNDADWAAWNTLMQDVGGAIAWMGFDGVLLDTEVEGQNWAWTGPGGLSTQALTNSLVASRARDWVEALNEGAGFDVPIYTYLSLPQAAEFPGCYCQYFCAYNGNNAPVAAAISNSVYPAFVYGMAQGTTAPIVNGDSIFYDWSNVCANVAPYGTGADTGLAATTSWDKALNMNLNGGVTYKGVTYQGFNNQRVNLSGTETALPSNCYLSPMLWLADNDDNTFNTATAPASGIWTTAQWAAALPAILEYCQYNTYSFFQGKTFIDYADNTYDDAPGYDYTPVKG
ncbi:MAG: hypothetical protein ACLPYY_21755 [Acidimicrobiales bacterium]